MATFTSMLLVNDRLVWIENSSTSPGSGVMHVLFIIFAVFKNLKSSFSEENMPVHVLKTPPNWFELSPLHTTNKV